MPALEVSIPNWEHPMEVCRVAPCNLFAEDHHPKSSEGLIDCLWKHVMTLQHVLLDMNAFPLLWVYEYSAAHQSKGLGSTKISASIHNAQLAISRPFRKDLCSSCAMPCHGALTRVTLCSRLKLSSEQQRQQ